MRNESGFRARGAHVFSDLSQDIRGRVTGHDWNGNNATAGGFDLLTANDLVVRPITTLHQDVGKEPGDQFARRQFVEYDDRIHTLQRRKDFRAFAFGEDGAPLALQLPYTCVAVESYDQRVTQFPSLLEAADVPRMKEIKAAIGENHSPTVAFLAAKPQNRLLKSECSRVQRISVRTQARMSLLKILVYHARWRSRLNGGAPR
jgi:hypothetical protein